jgi:hypothetical protein
MIGSFSDPAFQQIEEISELRFRKMNVFSCRVQTAACG